MIIIGFFSYIIIGILTGVLHSWMTRETDDDASIAAVIMWPLALPITLIELAHHYMVAIHNDMPLEEHLNEQFRGKGTH